MMGQIAVEAITNLNEQQRRRQIQFTIANIFVSIFEQPYKHYR